ncbi:MAG: aspartyl-phosphate phosphatase Spo0E family protein [Clostridia bacterium]|nr:aspartyl-phosphate phosphatase Spo0E family protein [Clostridia bacterium]
MLEKQIEELREKLNRSIEEGEDFDIIYKISTELDKLIVKYYRQKEAK